MVDDRIVKKFCVTLVEFNVLIVLTKGGMSSGSNIISENKNIIS